MSSFAPAQCFRVQRRLDQRSNLLYCSSEVSEVRWELRPPIHRQAAEGTQTAGLMRRQSHWTVQSDQISDMIDWQDEECSVETPKIAICFVIALLDEGDGSGIALISLSNRGQHA